MVRGKNTNGMVVLLLFFTATMTNAAPTMSEQNISLFTSALSANPDVHAYAKPEISFLTGPVDSRLAAIAAEIHKPPVDFSDSLNAAAGVKSLPHIPGAILMVLAGFICVSLIRDRKTWLTVLIGLLGLGQAGFAVLPHLAQLLSNRKQVELPSSDVAVLYQPRQNRLRSDIDGTYYIGLLHHLAGIPRADQFHLRFILSRSSAHTCYGISLSSAEAGLQSKRHRFHRTYLTAIIKLLSFANRVINYPTAITSRFNYIRSSFVFISTIRGPPHHA